MAGPDVRGSVFKTRSGDYGIRWPEAGKRPQRTGFRTKTDARDWFKEHVEPRLRDRAPDPSITFDAFCVLYLDRWAPPSRSARRTPSRSGSHPHAIASVFGRCANSRARAATSRSGEPVSRTRRATGSRSRFGRR
jgi:hypothetical protein